MAALAEGDMAWANNDAAGTAKTLAIPGTADQAEIEVIVKNPGASALSVFLERAWDDNGVTRYAAEAGPFTATAANGDGQAFRVDAGFLRSGGRVRATNVSVIGAAGAFTARCEVEAA